MNFIKLESIVSEQNNSDTKNSKKKSFGKLIKKIFAKKTKTECEDTSECDTMSDFEDDPEYQQEVVAVIHIDRKDNLPEAYYL